MQQDPFVKAFEDARARLISQEGRNVSVREVIRMADFTEGERPGVAYHLNTKKVWPRGHRVPPEVIKRLARVLPVAEEELQRAAQEAAGLRFAEPTIRPDLHVIVEFLDDEHVDQAEKDELISRMALIIAERVGRRRGRIVIEDNTVQQVEEVDGAGTGRALFVEPAGAH